MVAYLELHPENPQTRVLDKIVGILNQGGLIAYPTDSGFALACSLGNKAGLDRIREIRQVDSKHDFTLVCSDFAQLGSLVWLNNSAFRMVKRYTPGPYTFILEARKEVPRIMLNPKKKTVGVRIPDHVIAQAIVSTVGEPLISSTLILPNREEPETEAWVIRDEIGHLLDAIIDGPVESNEPTSVIDMTSEAPRVTRYGAGDCSLFES